MISNEYTVKDQIFFLLITIHYSLSLDGPLAQLVEQLTLNQRVAGSNPARLTIKNQGVTHLWLTPFLLDCIVFV